MSQTFTVRLPNELAGALEGDDGAAAHLRGGARGDGVSFAKRYVDRRPDLANLCLNRMSELHSRHSVITVDRTDFRFYRRNKREVILLICLPEG